MTTALLSQVGGGEAAIEDTLFGVSLSPDEVGARIATARVGKKWSQFDLALAFGVSPSTIYRWEKGKLPSMNELMRLAEVLGVSVSRFMDPPEQQAELADLRHLLEELRDDSELGRGALATALQGIYQTLARLEAQLSAEGGRAQGG